MLINFEYLLKKYNLIIKGVLHIGAHECEELNSYVNNGIEIDNQLWIEAIPEKVEWCQQHFDNLKIINAIIYDKDNDQVNFNITNNYQSSSILNLKTHYVEHPHVHVTKVIIGKTKTLKTIYDENNISYKKFNFLNIDIQGCEFYALKGMGDILNNIDYLYTSVNEKELYENCVLLPELDKFLNEKGFQRVELNMTPHGWGDAFYIREENNENRQNGENNENNDFVTYDYVGGLGNQLFGIYTAIAYGIKYHKKPVFIYKDNSPSVTHRITYWNTLFQNLQTYQGGNVINWNKEIHENNNSEYDMRNFENCNVIFKGYFQSYHNFINELNEINNIIGIEKQKEEVKNKYTHYFNNERKNIAIHFRLGDYKRLQHHPLLTDEYYTNSLREIENLDNKNIYVFCEKEDYDLVNERMESILKNVNSLNKSFQIITGENEIDELFLISLCNYIITANSTFSWWGAVFSNHKNVYIPSKWFFEETKECLVLNGWKIIYSKKYISILMPIYKNPKFMEETLITILNQTYKNWELIVGINSNLKNSDIYQIIKKYENNKIKIIEIFDKKRKSEYLNIISKLSKYEYNAVIDIDDKWEPDKLEIQVLYLDDYDVVGSKCIYYGDLDNIIPDIPTKDISNFDFTVVNPIINSSSIIKKELCYWNECEYLEDYELWLKLRLNNKKFYNCSEILIKEYVHKNLDFKKVSEEVKILTEKYKKKYIEKLLPYILYINLEYRTDRKQIFLDNFSDTGNIIRIDAVKDTNGAFGCLQSHIKSLEYAKNLGEYTLICEDDFQFIDRDYTIKKLENIFNSDLKWDLIMLGSNVISYSTTSYENIIKIRDAQTTSGYIIKKDYIDTLLNIYKIDFEEFKNTKNWSINYCVDISWKKLQIIDNWYSFLPAIGFQIESYSDIEKKITCYNC